MKRMICLALCGLLAVFACACGKEEATPTQAPPETAAVLQTEEIPAPTESNDTLSLKTFISTFDKTPAVEEAVIYEDEDLSVTVTGINYTAISGPGLQLSVQSNYEEDVILQAPYAVVNGFMISPKMSIEVPAGESANGSLTLPYFNLAISEIAALQNIEFAIRVVESECYIPITKTDLISVKTTATQNEEKDYNESGQTVYDKDGIKIILKGVNTDRAYSDGAELAVYMYNGTDSNIAIQTNDVIVNGYNMTSAMNRTILPDKRAVDVVTFYTLDMEEYAIDEIDSVTVSFVIKDAESWDTIDETDRINVELPQKETVAETTVETQ